LAPGTPLQPSLRSTRLTRSQGHDLGREFKALVSHDGVTTTFADYGSEELWQVKSGETCKTLLIFHLLFLGSFNTT